MPGIWGEWQPRYAAASIATFPVNLGTTKKPAVKGYLKIGLRASAALAAKKQFQSYDAFGFVPGLRHKITVLDIDTTDYEVLRDAVRRHGETPILIRTASGKFHAWYRHSGERRMIRPWPDLPIDVLGTNGYVVAAPSRRDDGGAYEFIRGSLEDVSKLPPMRGMESLNKSAQAAPRPAAIPKGTRNDELFRACMRQASVCNNVQQLEAYAMALNVANCIPPLDDLEARVVARKAWRYEELGRNAFSTGGIAPLRKSDLNLDPDAYWLLGNLLINHWNRSTFSLPKSYARSIGWSSRRLRQAAERIEKHGPIRRLSRGGKGEGDCAIYGWAPGQRRGG